MSKLKKIILSLGIVMAAAFLLAAVQSAEAAAASKPSSEGYIMIGKYKKDSYIKSGKYLWNSWEGKKMNASTMSYNKSTNTLTLKNCKSQNRVIGCYQMGTGFKIKVVGTNTIQALVVDAGDKNSKHRAWLDISGTGTLVLNQNKKCKYNPPLALNCEGTKSKMTIHTGVKLTSFVTNKKIATVWVGKSQYAKPLVIGGTYNNKVKSKKSGSYYNAYSTALTKFKKTK